MRFGRWKRPEDRKKKLWFVPRILLRILLYLVSAVFVFYLIVFITGWM